MLMSLLLNLEIRYYIFKHIGMYNSKAYMLSTFITYHHSKDTHKDLSILDDNISSVDVTLLKEDVKEIDDALARIDLILERWDPNSDNAKRSGK